MDFKSSVLASLAGGVVLGLLLTATGSMAGAAQLVGSDSLLVGWIVHLAVSALLGVIFAAALGQRVDNGTIKPLHAGLGYGFVWYLLGPLTLMPLLLGNGLAWSAAALGDTFASLIGHLIYGLVLGLSYPKLKEKQGSRTTAA